MTSGGVCTVRVSALVVHCIGPIAYLNGKRIGTANCRYTTQNPCGSIESDLGRQTRIPTSAKEPSRFLQPACVCIARLRLPAVELH